MKCAKLMTALVSASCLLAGCASGPADDKIQIEIVSYKPEAAKVFEEIQDLFNETHDDIHLTINSPNEAMTILKTRFVREDYPDIVAIGGDINYSGFLDAGLFENLEGQPFLDKVKEGYREIDKQLEFVPMDGDYAVPYVANAAGILYNRELFEEHG
ncbi:ABC transporter substrate-binding protein, partial [Faecalibaculum rodentium]